MIHKPVLLKEVLEIFAPEPGQNFIDGTANGGGHTFALWEKVKPNGKVLAIDKDGDLIERLKAESYELKADGVLPVCGSYANLAEIASERNFGNVAGVLLDFGYSSYHLEQSGRGFSFQKDEPLIMRYETQLDLGTGLTAQDVVNRYPEEELAEIFFRYGEEKHSRKIAKAICAARKKAAVKTSKELADIVSGACPKRFFYKIHPATKVFQALRVFVNDELGGLERALPRALDILKPGGKLIAISFHSLEDRIVKNFLRDEKRKGAIELINKKPLTAGKEEMAENPRARSAKLRAAQKLY